MEKGVSRLYAIRQIGPASGRAHYLATVIYSSRRVADPYFRQPSETFFGGTARDGMEWFERVTAVSCDGNGTARWVGACSLSHKVRGLSDQSRGNRYTSLFEVGLIYILMRVQTVD